MLDEEFVEKLNGFQMVPHYLMSSYAYQFLNSQYMSDTAYDKLCVRLYAQYDLIQHQHKHLIDKEALKSTTGYYLKASEYPTIVKVAAQSLVDMVRTGDM